jgi:hypothetical protein
MLETRARIYIFVIHFLDRGDWPDLNLKTTLQSAPLKLCLGGVLIVSCPYWCHYDNKLPLCYNNVTCYEAVTDWNI